MGVLSVFIFSIIILRSVDLANASSCSLDPEPEEGKHWLLWLNVSKLDVSVDPDMFAYWLARDNGFKVMHLYKGVKGFYVCEFRQSELDAIREQTPGGDEGKICRRQKKTITQGQSAIREHPAVDHFNRNPMVMTYKHLDKQDKKTYRVTINQAVGCKQENEEHVLAGNEIHFVETEEEKEIYYPCFIDVIDAKRSPFELM